MKITQLDGWLIDRVFQPISARLPWTPGTVAAFFYTGAAAAIAADVVFEPHPWLKPLVALNAIVMARCALVAPKVERRDDGKLPTARVIDLPWRLTLLFWTILFSPDLLQPAGTLDHVAWVGGMWLALAASYFAACANRPKIRRDARLGRLAPEAA